MAYTITHDWITYHSELYATHWQINMQISFSKINHNGNPAQFGIYSACKWVKDFDEMRAVFGVITGTTILLSVILVSFQLIWRWNTRTFPLAVPDLSTMMAYPAMGLLPYMQNCGLRMRRECRKSFSYHHGLAIATCITRRTCRDTYRDR